MNQFITDFIQALVQKEDVTEIKNTTEETRGVIYEVFATYNILTQDNRREPTFDIIQKEYDYLNLPSLDDSNFKQKLVFELDKTSDCILMIL